MRKVSLKVVAILVLFFVSFSFYGGTNQWTALGPISFTATCIAVSPQNQSLIYAGSYSALYISYDGGNNWTKKGQNIDSQVHQILIDPTVTSTIYTVTQSKIFKSIDSGETFYLSNLGLPSYLNRGAIDWSNTSILYIATDQGVYKTSNGAQNWEKVGVVDPTYDYADSIVIDPQNSSVLYVTNSQGIYKSEDGGENWTKLPPPVQYPYPSKLTISPFSSSTLYAIMNSKIYKSTDSGNSWTLLSNGLPTYYSAYDIEISQTNSEFVFAMIAGKLYLSSDGGTNWGEGKLSISSYYSYYPNILYSFQNGVVFCLANNIFKSTDDGLNFMCMGNSFNDISGLVFSPANSNIIYLATLGGGIKKSTDKGLSYLPKNVGLTDFELNTIAIDKSDANKIYVGTNSGAIFKSTDAGESWTKIYTVQPQNRILSIFVSYSNPQIIYSCTTSVGMIKSSDGGNNWISINNGLPSSNILLFALKPNTSDTLFAATDKGLYKTTDGGSNWSLSYGENKYISDVCISTVDTNLIFAMNQSDCKFIKSLDGGATWQEYDNWSYCNGITPDAIDKNIVYFITYSGLARSSDQGSTFIQISSPTYDGWYVDISSLTIDPLNHNNLFVGTSYYGVFQMEISCGTITTSPTTLPEGKENQYYSQTINFLGGLAPYSAVLSSGSLPNGFNLWTYRDYCTISGTPSVTGTYSFTLRITDAWGCTANKNFTLIITECATITISPDSLPTAYVNTPYLQNITASGGAAPYYYFVYSGYLPAGLNLSNDGILSGTTLESGNFHFVINVVDNSQCYASKSYNLRVEGGVVIDPSSLPSAIIGANYSQQLSASGGTSPYTFTILSGTLPPDLTISAGGLIFGVLKTKGTYSFSVKATDSNNRYGQQSYTIVVFDRLSCVITSSEPETRLGVPLTFTATISGGDGNYSILWDFGDGTQGTTNPATHIYNKVGTFNVSATVSDSSSSSIVSNILQIKVISDLTISSSVTPVQGNTPLKVTFASVVSGGKSPYIFVWDFGDGSSSSDQNCQHTYTKEGTYNWTLTVTDADGRIGMDGGIISVDKPLNPPTITSVQKLSSPFRLVINGFNFTTGCNVFINDVQVPSTSFKSSTKVVAKKGNSLKLLVPKGVRVEIKVRTVDGVESEPFYYTR
jgi:photosystem II stability/assembly factor-like uncharacterized protein/PKD repeat protein